MNKVKKYILIALVILIFLFLIYFYYHQEPEYFVSNEGILFYPKNRGDLIYTRTLFNQTENYTQEKVIFGSKGTKIYGYLFLPKTKNKVPAIVFLPAAQATKEDGGFNNALRLISMGYAVFTIDQRGIGETGGKITNMDEEFNLFINKKEPIQHQMVYDVLRSFDFLKEVKEVNKNKIAFMGESMGGRFAIIAAAIERNSNGVVVISTSGYGTVAKVNTDALDFFKSINPDTYMKLISPRKVIMIHTENDDVVPLDNALYTFNLANEPKRFLLIKDKECKHGYCDKMYEGLKKELEDLFKN